jgi:hypothetical protein
MGRLFGALREHIWLALGAALLSWVIAFLWWAMLPSSSTIEITIPLGTAQHIAAGEVVDVLPSKLSLRIGDRLVLHNQDEAVHRIGPAFVPPGQSVSVSVTRSFFDAATLVCSFHPSGGLPVVPLARPSILATLPIGMAAGIPLALAAVLAASVAGRLDVEGEAEPSADPNAGS